MRKLKIKLLKMIVWICDRCLEHKDGAEDQNQINEVISDRNWAKRKLESISK